MIDWLNVYNEADVIPLIEAVDKTCKQYYPDEIDILKDSVSIPGISMMYVLNKSLKMKQPSEPELFGPGQPYFHTCTDCEEAHGVALPVKAGATHPKPGCEKCKKVQNNCTQYTKDKPYELPKTSVAGSLSTVFWQYHESGESRIRSHYNTDAKICAIVIGFDANSLYLYCSEQEMPCRKEEYIEVDRPNDMEELCNQVMKGTLFGFLQVNIHIPGELIDKFSEFCPLFVVDSIPDESIPSHMKEYQTRTG